MIYRSLPSTITYCHQCKHSICMHRLTYLVANSDNAHCINRGIWVTSIYVHVLSTTQMLYTNTLSKRHTCDGLPHTQENMGRREFITVTSNQLPIMKLPMETYTKGQKVPKAYTPRLATLTEDTNDAEHTVTDGKTNDVSAQNNYLVQEQNAHPHHTWKIPQRPI